MIDGTDKAATETTSVALRLTRRSAQSVPADGVVRLTYDQRARSRLRARLDDGREIGILLARGENLRDRDLLASEDGTVIEVRAALESVSTVLSDDSMSLARAAYHLGNRHVALEVQPGRLRWLHDHVLDAMVQGLGLTVTREQAPFEPEPGAYGAIDGHVGGAHDHGHAH